MPILLLAARLLLAAVFFVAALTKLADPAGSRRALIDFGVPSGLAPVLALALPLAELAIAIALLPLATAWAAAVGALLLLGTFIVGIGLNLARGRRPDCHCFGQLHSEPVGAGTLARNALLAVVAALLVARGPHQIGGAMVGSAAIWPTAPSWGEHAVIAGLLAAILAVAADAWLLTSLLAQHGRVLARLDALEARLAPDQRRTAGRQVLPGLPLGTTAPAFTLPDLDGRPTSLADLLSSGRPLILLFMDASCGPCTALLPTVIGWHRDLASVALAIVSWGNASEIRHKFGLPGLPRVLWQERADVSARYQVVGTPSAVLVQSAGRIGSGVAGGAEAIGALVAAATSVPGFAAVPSPRPFSTGTTG